MEDARSNSTEPTRVESIAAEHEQVDSQEDSHADRKGDIFLPNVSPVEKIQVVAELAELRARMKDLGEMPYQDNVPRNRAEKRSRARPRKGGSSGPSPNPGRLRELPIYTGAR